MTLATELKTVPSLEELASGGFSQVFSQVSLYTTVLQALTVHIGDD